MAADERTTSFPTNWWRSAFRGAYKKVPLEVLSRGSQGGNQGYIHRRIWEPYEESIGTSGTLRLGGDKNAQNEHAVWRFLEQELVSDPDRVEKFKMLRQFLGSDGKAQKYTVKMVCDLDNAWNTTAAGRTMQPMGGAGVQAHAQADVPRPIRGRLWGRRVLLPMYTGTLTHLQNWRDAAKAQGASNADKLRWTGMLDAVLESLEEAARIQHKQGGLSYDQVMGEEALKNALRRRAGLSPAYQQQQQQQIPRQQGPTTPDQQRDQQMNNAKKGLFLSHGKSSSGFDQAKGPIVFMPDEKNKDHGYCVGLGKSIDKFVGKTTVYFDALSADAQAAINEGFERRLPVMISADGQSAQIVEDPKKREYYAKYGGDQFLGGDEAGKGGKRKKGGKVESLEDLIEEDEEIEENLKEEFKKAFEGVVEECNSMDDWTELHRTLYTIKDKYRDKFIEKLDGQKMKDMAESIFDDIRGDLEGVGRDAVKFRETFFNNLKSNKMFASFLDGEDYKVTQKIGNNDTRTKLTREMENRLIDGVAVMGGIFWNDAISGIDAINRNNKAMDVVAWRPGTNDNPLFHAYQRVLKEEYANPVNHPTHPGLGANAGQQYAGLNAMMFAWSGVNAGGGIPNVVNNNAAGAAAGNMATIRNATEFDRALVRLHRNLHPDKAWFAGTAGGGARAAGNVAARGAALVRPLDAATMEQVQKDLRTVRTQLPNIPQALRDQIFQAEQIAALMSVAEQAQVCTPETAKTVIGNRKTPVQWKMLIECMTPLAPPPNYTVEPEHAHMFRKIPSNMKAAIKNDIATNAAGPLRNGILGAGGGGPGTFERELANAEMRSLEDIFKGATSGHSQAEVIIKTAGNPKYKTRAELGDTVQGHLNALDQVAHKASTRIKTAESFTRV